MQASIGRISGIFSFWMEKLKYKPFRSAKCYSFIDIINNIGNWYAYIVPLHWLHNDHGGVSNHQPHGCLLNSLIMRGSKKTSKLRVTGLCAGNSPGPVNSPHKGPVTRKMGPFGDVIMQFDNLMLNWKIWSTDNSNTHYWPPGSSHTLGAGGHI